MAETRLETYREFHIMARRIFPRRRVVRKANGELDTLSTDRYQLRVVSPLGGNLTHLRRADAPKCKEHRLNLPLNEAIQEARLAVDKFHKRSRTYGRFVSPLFWGGALAGAGLYSFLSPVSEPAAIMAALAGVGGMAAPGLNYFPKPQPALRMGGFDWDDNDFCRSWFGTGKTGSGKTESGVKGLLAGLSIGRPDWGGMAFDQKGLFWEELVPLMTAFEREDDLQLLQIRPPNAPKDWVPQAQYNLLSDERIPSRTLAKLVMDTSKRVAGADDPNPFFPQQAQQQIFACIEFFRTARKLCNDRFPGPPALHRIYDLLSYEHICRESIKVLRESAPGNEDAHRVCQLLELDYLGQPEEQKGGVKATAQLALIPFTTPEAIEVFCPPTNTADIEDINDGAIFCISMPQRFEVERVFVATIMKEVGCSQLFRRFDPRESWQKSIEEESIFAFFMDEWQKFINERDLDTDRSRQAKGTFIGFTQGHGSPRVAMSDTKLQVGLSNMANRIHGRAADDYDAQETAKFFPLVRKLERVRPGKGGKEYKEKPPYDPNTVLKQMAKFEVIVNHCEKGHKRVVLHPTGRDGKRPKWYPAYMKTFGNFFLKIGLYRILARIHFSGGAPRSGKAPGKTLEEIAEMRGQYGLQMGSAEGGITREAETPEEDAALQVAARDELLHKKPAGPVSDLAHAVA